MWLSGQGWKNGCGVFLFEDYFFSSGISVQHEKSSTLLCMFHHNLALLTPFCPLSWSLYNFQWCSPVVSHFQIFHLSTQSKSAQHILWVSFSNLPLTCSFQNMKIQGCFFTTEGLYYLQKLPLNVLFGLNLEKSSLTGLNPYLNLGGCVYFVSSLSPAMLE